MDSLDAEAAAAVAAETSDDEDDGAVIMSLMNQNNNHMAQQKNCSFVGELPSQFQSQHRQQRRHSHRIPDGISESGSGSSLNNSGPPGGRSVRRSSYGKPNTIGSFAVPNNVTEGRRPPLSTRRSSHSLTSRRSSPVSNLSENGSPHGSNNAFKSIKNKVINMSVYSRGKSTRHVTSFNTVDDYVNDTEAAMEALGSGQTTDITSMAAAAALVQEGTTGLRNDHRYGINEEVLVYLRLMNHTQPGQAEYSQPPGSGGDGDGTSWGTANPVNKSGFPQGKGETEEERKGPFVYVLAKVKAVHFEEDARYYTVTRADTNLEQRADAEWMVKITSQRGQTAARAAAQTLRKSKGSKHSGVRMSDGSSTENNSKIMKACCLCIIIFHCIYRLLSNCLRCFNRQICSKCRTSWQNFRKHAKLQARSCLNGLKPYECRIRMTGINVMVFCSCVIMFLDQFRLAFLPASADYALTIVSLVVWIILLLELFVEVFIRPEGYSVLVKSEKSYAPSTQRYINRFHLVFETFALLTFIPELLCIFQNKSCGEAIPGSLIFAALRTVTGPGRKEVFYGHCLYALVRFRIFGLVRHWKLMWINSTYTKRKKEGIIRGFLTPNYDEGENLQQALFNENKKEDNISQKKDDDDIYTGDDEEDGAKKGAVTKKAPTREEDLRLNHAATIGTALLVINSHRAMILLVAIIGFLPIIGTIKLYGGANNVSSSMVEFLQQNNIGVPQNNTFDCDYLETTIYSWLRSNAYTHRNENPANSEMSLVWARLLPLRCPFQTEYGNEGVITADLCKNSVISLQNISACQVWGQGTATSTPSEIAQLFNPVIRSGEIQQWTESTELYGEEFYVSAMFDEEHVVHMVNQLSFWLQLTLLILILIGLSVLRGDAGRLVLDPLRRMLKIMLRYAENPLDPPKATKNGKRRNEDGGPAGDESGSDLDDVDDEEDQLGHYETEQLISAIAKITDLLRKCWGVAGADIISSNLARTSGGKTVGFNPCVPGKIVYALFGFVGINDFSNHTRSLDQDVMILINDVARVVHGEVYRWGLGESGQCNKNLGGAFLMVFRIGDSETVQEKKDKATAVIFASAQNKKSSTILKRRTRMKVAGKTAGNRHSQSMMQIKKKKNAVRRRKTSDLMSDSLQLASLPGIAGFTDRAVIGMLKSFAGIHRDKNISRWKEDFRLGAGVGAFSVDMIFGMDAGWAVEGAVGSEYKIDATYLSPHVNMASRMMSACKQYGVFILLSNAVQELMSDTAKSKLRHLDTVTVKGSSLRQPIYTYDARHKGVDFFLFSRSEKDADLDAECYSPSIWNSDQDLKAMRQHITPIFLQEFALGRDQYLAGNWDIAIQHLKKAYRIMVTDVVEEGYIDDYIEDVTDGLISTLLDCNETSNPEVVRLRNEIGDRPSQRLINFMEARGGVAPSDWEGYRPLTSK